MNEIDLFSLTAIPLEIRANDQPLGTATGFIWKHGQQFFLITNWHVITGCNAQTGKMLDTIPVRPEQLRAHFSTNIDTFQKKEIQLNLRDDGTPLWFVHPTCGRGSDVVAIPLPYSEADPVIRMYPLNVLKSEAELAVKIGMDVFILGYPFPITPPIFPVWKRGSIASEPALTPSGPGYMLVDTASRPGMSGAPVIRRSWGYHLLTDDRMSMDVAAQSKFIGIYSGRFHTEDKTDAQLGMVWPVSDVEEIVAACKLHED